MFSIGRIAICSVNTILDDMCISFHWRSVVASTSGESYRYFRCIGRYDDKPHWEALTEAGVYLAERKSWSCNCLVMGWEL